MNCKKYRACLVGVIAAVLMVGAFIYVKNSRSNQIPADGTLVKNCEDSGDRTDLWV